MTALETLVETPAAAALGWALVHSLWQGALAAVIVAAARFAFRSARTRYACACAAMLAVLAAFVFTFARLLPPGGRLQPIQLAIPAAPEGIFPVDAAPTFHLTDVLPWIVPFWIAGVILFHLRSLFAWIAVARMRRRGVCQASLDWRERLDRLRSRIKLSKPVALLETGMAEVPVVIGYLRPVILMPAGLLAGMPANQVEAILLHELAHVRRLDYLVNLLQTLVEGFLFYHPAIWWISGVIRAERENCCDDLVVAASGNAHAYAAALAALEQTRGAAHEAALAATGGNLMKRIHRLLYQPKGSAFAPLFSAGILALAIAGALAAWQASTPAPAQQTPQAKADPYKKWVQEDVVYLIDDRERTAFLSLTTNEERDMFIEQFWERRNPTPGSAVNSFKTEHYRRLARANTHYSWNSTPGWKTDRGRIYILYGPPDEIESHPSGEPARNGNVARAPFEQWRYRTMKGIGTNVIVDFEDEKATGEYRMTKDPNAKDGTLVKNP